MAKAQKPAPFQRLMDLGEARYDELRDRLRKGDSVPGMVRLLQEEWAVCTDVKPDSLRKLLERQRQALRQEVVQSLVEFTVGKPTGAIVKRIDVLDELEKLAAVQRGRFHKLLAREQQGPLLMDAVSREAKLYQDMLSDLAQLHLETGLIRRAPKQVQGLVTDPDGRSVAFSWTEEQEELMKVIEHVARDDE